MKENRIDFNNMIYIDQTAHSLLWKSEVKPGMVLLSMSGTIGDVAIASKKWEYPINSNQDIAKIIINGDLNPYYLYSFLISKYGQNYLKREARGSVQQHVFLSQMDNFEIPFLKDVFVKPLQVIIERSEDILFESQNRYNNAEYLLLNAVNLEKFKIDKEPINIKSFKDSFLASGRLDAEYYQLKYEQVISHIRAQKHDKLINLVTISKSIEPGSAHYSDDDGLSFYRVSDYDQFGLTEPDKKLTHRFVNQNAALIESLKPQKGTILFSKDGSVGTAYLLRENLKGITSGAILHLKIKDSSKIIPEYLTIVLNSKLVRMQAERDAGGSIILHWRTGEIENVVVPIIDYDKQKEIAVLVEESFRLKIESERLLEAAKTAVEIAIEQNEEHGLTYLKANT